MENEKCPQCGAKLEHWSFQTFIDGVRMTFCSVRCKKEWVRERDYEDMHRGGH